MFPYEQLGEMLESDLSEAAFSTPHRVFACHCEASEARRIAIVSLRTAFYKKLSPLGDTTVPDAAALKKFLSRLPKVGLRPPSEVYDDVLLNQFKQNMHALLGGASGQFDLQSLAERWVPGPGKSRHQNDSGSFFHKYFQGPLSASSELVFARFRAALMYTPVWALAERQRFDEFGVVIEDASTAFFAPKNAEESRFCATEPGVDMLFMRAIGEIILDELLGSYGIDLSTQAEKNKLLAQAYSICQDGATVDLTSASDSESIELVDEYVPNPLRGLLHLYRTSHTVLPDKTRVALPMISTMGNGFTFPLQCAVFACIVRSAYQLSDKAFPTGRNNHEWGVFGDDIIVPTIVLPKVRRLLWLLGFEVNEKKTFESGPFRESCGGDYYNGFDVRGVYIRSLETAAMRYSAVNRLLRWSALHKVHLRRTVGFLLSQTRNWQKYLIPHASFSDDAGVKVPSSYLPDGYKGRYLTVRKHVHKVPYDSGTYLGYNLGLYVAMLYGAVKSQDWDLSTEAPPSKGGYGPLPSGHVCLPGLEITLRDRDNPTYDSRTLQVDTWWDWEGLNPPPNGWETTVLSTLLG